MFEYHIFRILLTTSNVFICPAPFLSTLESTGPSMQLSIRSDIDFIFGIISAFTTSGPSSERPSIAPYNEAKGVCNAMKEHKIFSLEHQTQF